MVPPMMSLDDQIKLAQREVEDSKESRIVSMQKLGSALQHLEEAKSLYAQAQREMDQANTRLQNAIIHISELELRLPGKWNTMYQKFVEFKEKYGHCNVSQDSFSTRTRIRDFETQEEQDRKSLARWVGNQRVDYKKFHSGQHSCLNQQRIDALNRIGFIWDLKGAKWYMKYNELVKFQKENGHCRVPHTFNAELSKWVIAQRYSWKRKRDGKGPPHLTAEREALLTNIAFDFEYEC